MPASNWSGLCTWGMRLVQPYALQVEVSDGPNPYQLPQEKNAVGRHPQGASESGPMLAGHA